MNVEAVLEKNTKLLAWADEYSQELGNDISILKREHAIDGTDDLLRSFQDLEEENRLLQIGVIGRVKSGKSSLLNALVFNGDNILPHAATPMTAALTTLTYADNFYAKVEFYSEQDKANLRAKSAEYVAQLDVERENARKELQERQQRRKKGVGVPDHDAPADFEEKVEKIAQRKMQENQALSAAHDQWQRIIKANIDQETLDANSIIKADSAQALARQLSDFVGADGQFMPLTKSVDIFLPLESLRDIRIIDTPGFNDPIVSREERTEALLKDCDVVLIVSPSGQFLSAQDIELITRVTQKEGVRELVVLASQVDNQLYGSSKQASLKSTLENITSALGQHLHSTLQRLKENSPEIGSTFDGLLQQGSKRILHTSGICHNLSVHLEQPHEWNSGEKHVMQNLQLHYPDFFGAGNIARCRSNLDVLSNMEALKGILAEVRECKDSILSQRRASLAQAKGASLANFHKALLEVCREREQQLKNTDINEIKKAREHLDRVMLATKQELDDLLDEGLSDLGMDIRSALNKQLKNAYAEVEETSQAASREKQETCTVAKRGVLARIAKILWNGGTREEHVTVLEVRTSHVRAAVETFLVNIGVDLHDTSASLIRRFRKTLEQQAARVASEHLGDEFDIRMLKRSVMAVMGNLDIPEFELGDVDLRAIKAAGGTLRGETAERFLDNARRIMLDLKVDAEKQIKRLSQNIAREMPRNFGGDLFLDMQQRITQLEQEIEYKSQSLDRLQRMIKSLLAIEV